MRAPALEALGGATSLVLLGAIALAPTSALPHFPCPLRALTSIPCVTCGGTRAILALRDGDLVGALVMNPLVVLAIFAALAFATYAAAVLVLGVPPWRPDLRKGAGLWALRVGVPVALAANWIYLVAAGR